MGSSVNVLYRQVVGEWAERVVVARVAVLVLALLTLQAVFVVSLVFRRA